MHSDTGDIAIRARGLGKRYAIYDKPHHRMMDLFMGTSRARSFWALRGVDFDVYRGETVGIVGRNGSGKSTLLQMLARTLEPSEGSIEIRGKVAALLELGAGFNPDFTGRENVEMNAALLGLDARQIAERFDSIAEFADIGEFLEQPVRTYSSGMYVRLAFAVAVASQPDILIVDEALSVGDETFQRKCFSRIEELKRGGATILFVSHSANAVLQLCDRAILIDRGRRLLTGAPKTVVGYYQRLIYAPTATVPQVEEEIRLVDSAGGLAEAPQAAHDADHVEPVRHDVRATERLEAGLRPESTVEYAPRGARILDPHILNDDGKRVNVLASGGSYRYVYEVEFLQDARQTHFGMMLKSMSGVELFGMASHPQGTAVDFIPAGSRVQVSFRLTASLLPGMYFLNAGCMAWDGSEGEIYLHRVLDACLFRIDVPRTNRRMSGFFDVAEEPACQWERLS